MEWNGNPMRGRTPHHARTDGRACTAGRVRENWLGVVCWVAARFLNPVARCWCWRRRRDVGRKRPQALMDRALIQRRARPRRIRSGPASPRRLAPARGAFLPCTAGTAAVACRSPSPPSSLLLPKISEFLSGQRTRWQQAKCLRSRGCMLLMGCWHAADAPTLYTRCRLALHG